MIIKNTRFKSRFREKEIIKHKLNQEIEAQHFSKIIYLSKILYIVSLGFIFTFPLTAQNTAPAVSNVNFIQRSDGTGIVDVFYDVSDDHSAGMLISMVVSDDAGATWTIIPTHISGDIGEGIIQGPGKHIIWNAGLENYYLQESGQYRFKIIADDTILLTDFDGNVYETIWIGDVLWMAENLNTLHYRNGVAIPYAPDNGSWGGNTSGAYCYFNNNPAYEQEYGKLYNWYATINNDGLCPEGWHVPTHSEWEALFTSLGGTCSGGNGINETCTFVGGKLKEAGFDHWNSPNAGATNEIGFTGLPGGCRGNTGTFWGHWYGSYGNGIGFWGNLWSSTAYDGISAYKMDMRYHNNESLWMPVYKQAGYSIRCKED